MSDEAIDQMMTEAAAALVASTFVPQRVQRKQPVGREARFHNPTWSKHEDWRPRDVLEFLRGGMRKVEWMAGQRARDEAIRFERELWLPTLEGWLAEAQQEEHGPTRAYLVRRLTREIRRLHRCLGLHQSPEERRTKTRERVRALRAKRKAAAA